MSAVKHTKKMENIEREEVARYTVFPTRDHGAWALYERQNDAYWLAHEVDTDLLQDARNWKNLPADVQNFLKHIIAFFLVSDTVVNENIELAIERRIKTRELKMWYDVQKAIENVHSTVYSKFVDTYIKDEAERKQIFNTMQTHANIRAKVAWVQRWIGATNEVQNMSTGAQEGLKQLWALAKKALDLVDQVGGTRPSLTREMQLIVDQLQVAPITLAQQLIAATILEGVFFSGSFAAVFWTADVLPPNQQLPGFTKGNELISRDESLHVSAHIYVYNTHITQRLSQQQVHAMFREAVDIESRFLADALPTPLIGMNAQLMTQYVKYVADDCLVRLKYERLYNVTNPFKFMERQAMTVRITDFFASEVTEYKKAGASTSNASDNQVVLADWD